MDYFVGRLGEMKNPVKDRFRGKVKIYTLSRYFQATPLTESTNMHKQSIKNYSCCCE